MLSRVKNSLSDGATTIKGILGRSEHSTWRREEQAQAQEVPKTQLFRLGFHQHPNHPDVDERICSLRKEWKKYVKLHGASESCEDQFRAVIDALEQIHRGQNQAAKVDICSILGKDSGFCVELARRFVQKVEGFGWIVQTPGSSSLACLKDAEMLPLLFAMSYVEWERSTVKGFCELKLPSLLIRNLCDHVDAISYTADSKQNENRRSQDRSDLLIEEIVLDVIGRMLEYRETIEHLSDLTEAALCLLFDLCTSTSKVRSETVKHCRTGALKVVSRLLIALDPQYARVDVAGLALAQYFLVIFSMFFLIRVQLLNSF